MILSHFSGGSWACRVVECSSISKMDRQIEGLSSLSGLGGGFCNLEHSRMYASKLRLLVTGEQFKSECP